MPRVASNCICLAVIWIDFVLKKDGNYSLQVFLKECKYIEKEEKVIIYITDGLEISCNLEVFKSTFKASGRRFLKVWFLVYLSLIKIKHTYRVLLWIL